MREGRTPHAAYELPPELPFMSVGVDELEDQLSGGLLGGRRPAISASARKMITSSARTPMRTHASVLRYVQAGLLAGVTDWTAAALMSTTWTAPTTENVPADGVSV